MELSVLGAPALGGVLVGLGGAGLLLTHGRIAGVSGLMRGALLPGEGDRAGRLGFLIGALVAGALLSVVAPAALANDTGGSLGQAVVAGLLVGAGSQLGNGCTSGHTFGLGRLSPRSVVALTLFVSVGALSLLLGRWLAGGAA